MALGILSEDKGVGLAVLYNTVTMTTFGPVMPCATWAETFIKWLGDLDPRTMEPGVVSAKWDDFVSECRSGECKECGVMAAGGPCVECSE